MIDLTNIDMRILEEVQQDFPLSPRPFKEMAGAIGISEKELIAGIENLKKMNIIRDISAIFVAGALGYKSTLVAVKSADPETAAGRINLHPGVSHNYLREHIFNLWFTITIKNNLDFDTEIIKLLGPDGGSYHILPSLKTFKIGVNFSFTDKIGKNRKKTVIDYKAIDLDENLIIQLQKQFPLVPSPWKVIAESMNISETELMFQIEGLKKAGAIKRISAVIRHRNAGFTANGMACFNIPAQRIDYAGSRAASFPEVSHCYQRPVFPDWKYNLFAMTHSRSKVKCEEIIDRIARNIDAEDYFTLYSIKEFKKERVQYFMEDTYVQ